MASGGVFMGGDGVEYRWKSHRQRLQVNRPLCDVKRIHQSMTVLIV
jgi:hypothetical protein